DDIRMMAGSIARDLGKRHVETAVVSGTNLTETYTNFSDDDVVTAFVEGWHLGSYEFVKYKTKNKGIKTQLEVAEVDSLKDAVEKGETRSIAIMLSRDLMNELLNVLNPVTIPSVLVAKFSA